MTLFRRALPNNYFLKIISLSCYQRKNETLILEVNIYIKKNDPEYKREREAEHPKITLCL